jgi:hypothetical protein
MSEAYGRIECDVKMMEYRNKTSYVDHVHSAAFIALFSDVKGVEKDYLDGQWSRVQDALLNLMATITVLTNMRYCFQDVLFLSALSLMRYVRARDFGQRSEFMLPFMKACVAELMTQWENARTVISDYTREDTDELLANCRMIPDLSDGGKIDVLYRHYQLKDSARGGLASALIHNHQQGPQGGAALTSPAKTKTSGDKKHKKKGDTGKSPSPSKGSQKTGGSSSSSSSSSSTAGNATGGRMYCYFFNTAKGCKYPGTGTCRNAHENPAKGSSDALAMKKYFDEHNWTPSKDFVKNSQ